MSSAFRSSSTNAGSGTVTVTLPTGSVAGDLLIITGNNANSATLAVTQPVSGVTSVFNAAMGTGTALLAYKILDATDITAGSVKISATSGSTRVILASYSGVSSVTAGVVTYRSGSQTTCTAKAVSGATTMTLVISMDKVTNETGLTSVVPTTTQDAAYFTNATSAPSIYIGHYSGTAADRTITYPIASANGLGIQLALVDTASTATPLLEWGFNEASGNVALDSSGNGYHGTVFGRTPGHTYHGAKGDASHSAANVHTSGSTTLGDFTLMEWLYPTRQTADQLVLLATSNENDVGGGYLVAGWSSSAPGKLYLGAGNSAGTGFFSDSSIASPMNTWQHVALVWIGLTAYLVLDGVQAASVTITGSRPTEWRRVEAGGESMFGSYDLGIVDDVRLFSSGLSLSDINTWKNTPVTANVPNKYVSVWDGTKEIHGCSTGVWNGVSELVGTPA